MSRAHKLAETVRQALQDGVGDLGGNACDLWPKTWENLTELERLAGQAERMREALAHIAAVLRGMQSDDTITQRIDLTPEITMADHAIEASLLADGTAV